MRRSPLLPALLLAALAGQAAAQPANLYTVRDIPVDETAETVTEAKAEAISSARMRAFGILLRRLTVEADHPRLPRPDGATVEKMANTFQVSNERTSPVRYLADITVGFRREPVRALLREQGIAFSDTRSGTVILFPVYGHVSAPMLFEEGNPWRQAWAGHRQRNDPVPLALTRGDVADRYLLTALQAVRGEAEPITALARRYGSSRAVVAHAEPAAADGSALDIAVRQYGPGSVPGTRTVRITRAVGEAIADLLPRGVREVDALVQETWKRANLVAADSREERIEAVAPIRGLAELRAIKGRLGQIGLISTVRMESLKRREARFVLAFVGGLERLRPALQQRDLLLERDPGGDWVLRLPPRP